MGEVRKISGAGGAVGYERDGEQVFVHADRVGGIDAIADADERWAAVQSAKVEAAGEWERERGPDSLLGRGMEAGTPTSDHSSDPQPRGGE